MLTARDSESIHADTLRDSMRLCWPQRRFALSIDRSIYAHQAYNGESPFKHRYRVFVATKTVLVAVKWVPLSAVTLK